MNITKVVDECDARRLNEEGVGLSDALVNIIVYAYTEGVNFAYAQKEGVKPETRVTASKNDCIKTTSLSDFSKQDWELLSELVDNNLREMDINPASFAFSIEVDYTEEERES